MIQALITTVHQAVCPHAHRVRERRDTVAADNVLHLVCEACGHAVPALERTTRERQRARRWLRRREVRA